MPLPETFDSSGLQQSYSLKRRQGPQGYFYSKLTRNERTVNPRQKKSIRFTQELSSTSSSQGSMEEDTKHAFQIPKKNDKNVI